MCRVLAVLRRTGTEETEPALKTFGEAHWKGQVKLWLSQAPTLDQGDKITFCAYIVARIA